MNRLRLYLAHPVLQRAPIREIELRLERQLNIDLINPFYDNGRKDILDVDFGKAKLWERQLDYASLVEEDMRAIRNSDGLLSIWLEQVFSIGTSMEIFYASKVLGKPTIVYVYEKLKGHPWLRYFTKVVTTESELVDELEKLKQLKGFIS